jgi:hypothetical protein
MGSLLARLLGIEGVTAFAAWRCLSPAGSLSADLSNAIIRHFLDGSGGSGQAGCRFEQPVLWRQ